MPPVSKKAMAQKPGALPLIRHGIRHSPLSAEKRRFGTYATELFDPDRKRKALAAMIRANTSL